MPTGRRRKATGKPKATRAKGGRSHGADGDDLMTPRRVTGKDLSSIEEVSARLTALVEMLDEKGVINSREYSRVVAMRLHEISKAAAIEELEDEL